MRLPPRTYLPGALAVAVATVVCVPSPALAAGSGGPPAPAPAPGTTPATPTGGTAPGSVSTPSAQPENQRRRSTSRPSLVAFHANARRFYDLGSPARVVFRIDGRSATVRVKLQVRLAG